MKPNRLEKSTQADHQYIQHTYTQKSIQRIEDIRVTQTPNKSRINTSINRRDTLASPHNFMNSVPNGSKK